MYELYSRSGHLEERKTFLLMLGIEPRIIGRLTHSPVTIPFSLD
jgi:hypothetical protein